MNTFTMDRQTFDALPDRSRLTGMPLPNAIYRDSGEPSLVFKWSVDPLGLGTGAWLTFEHVEP